MKGLNFEQQEPNVCHPRTAYPSWKLETCLAFLSSVECGLLSHSLDLDHAETRTLYDEMRKVDLKAFVPGSVVEIPAKLKSLLNLIPSKILVRDGYGYLTELLKQLGEAKDGGKYIVADTPLLQIFWVADTLQPRTTSICV